MVQESFTTIILTPSEGFFLTQIDENIDINERIVASQVALGRYDKPENWKEISSEEAEEIKNLQEEARRKEMEEHEKNL